ncbi:MAG: DNA polymerase Y family protein [Pseudomonas oryzihabitans]|uniref:Y-family DNA polymerase n=1 Tax=Pseudomonas oryzihabitans TaxID=47885 RepID=UPI002907FF1B|nr:DNA polymerase Y family protein [Pseudomonas oryzihabitans]MDU4058659.1 DNA polymerase Y family protein [Pseudomonas oryzihabitans]
MRWACIYFPQFALDGVLRNCPDPDEPLVLLQGPIQRRIIKAANPAALALGLRPKMTFTAAQAICPQFTTVEYDDAALQRQHQLLAAWAYGFSSQVSLHFPDALVLEVQSSLPLFGPWPRFEARLRQELTGLGFGHRITLAPNPVAARVLANAGDSLAVRDDAGLSAAMRTLPVALLGFDPDIVQALSRMGLRQLDQLLALPRAQLARRFPVSLLNHLDQMLGSNVLPLEFFLPPTTFQLRIELNFEVESTQALLFPLRRLTSDLATYLAGRDMGAQRFTVRLEHREARVTEVVVGLLAPERDPALLFEFARGRLEPTQVVEPVLAIGLIADELPSFVPQHRGLFDERPQQTVSWEQLRERLHARLGDDAVCSIGAQGDHRPERAWQRDTPSLAVQALGPNRRPGWLLPTPELLGASVLRVLSGPERIESGWWDGEDARRDYYVLELKDGRTAWAFQATADGPGWWVQGWFA